MVFYRSTKGAAETQVEHASADDEAAETSEARKPAPTYQLPAVRLCRSGKNPTPCKNRPSSTQSSATAKSPSECTVGAGQSIRRGGQTKVLRTVAPQQLLGVMLSQTRRHLFDFGLEA
jgi:hypothetical protein